mgnify:CR=1 FL=1
MIRTESAGCARTGLRGVTLQVRPGELVAVAGPNGAGKSTLLSLLAGERLPDEGAVLLDERRVAALPPEERARRIGVLPQAASLTFAFRVDEVVGLGRLGGADRAAVRRAMEEAGVDHLAARSYPTLSGGEKQRVHLARVLAQLDGATRPFLLLDEPTSSLDPAQQHAVLSLARERARRGWGVVAVLHDLALVGRYADRVLLLRDGRVQACGTPWEVLTPVRLAACYGIEAVVLPHPADGSPLVVAA